MAENENDTATAGGAATGERQLAVHRIYLKDGSFESPNSPDVFRTKWEPKVTLNISTSANGLGSDTFEVVLHVTVDAKVEERSAFLCEVQQAGIFLVQGFPEEERKRLLGGYCPGVVFPYAREAISDLIAKGGFPQMLLQPVNFDALYAQHASEVQHAQSEAGAAEKH